MMSVYIWSFFGLLVMNIIMFATLTWCMLFFATLPLLPHKYLKVVKEMKELTVKLTYFAQLFFVTTKTICLTFTSLLMYFKHVSLAACCIISRLSFEIYENHKWFVYCVYDYCWTFEVA